MRLGLRVFFGFFLIAGLSAVLLLKVFLAEVKPSVREVMEDLMVDTANLLAEVAAEEMATGAPPADGRLAAPAQAQFDHALADRDGRLHPRPSHTSMAASYRVGRALRSIRRWNRDSAAAL